MLLTPFQIWEKACKHDKMPVNTLFAVFSKNNPWVKRYDEAVFGRVRAKAGTWDRKKEEPSLGIKKVKELIYLPRRNSNLKLGNMLSFPLMRGETCPEKTEICNVLCYGNTGNIMMTQRKYIEDHGSLKGFAYKNNFLASQDPNFAPAMIERLDSYKRYHQKKGDMDEYILRMLPTRDFYNKQFIKKIKEVADNSKGWKIYGYTRSWQDDELRKELENLNESSNVNILASTDPTTGEPPKGWKESGMHGRWTGEKHQCEFSENKIPCSTCKQCVDKKKGGTVIPLHSVSKSQASWFINEQGKAMKGGIYVPDVRDIELVGAGHRLSSPYKGTWSKRRKPHRTTSKVSRVR